MKRLEKKVVIITGAGSGIGRAAAELFAAEGAKLVVADYDLEAGEETARAIQAAGREALLLLVDVSQSDQVQQMVNQTIQTYGQIDVLFNNAGIVFFGNVLDTSEEMWDKVMEVNLKGIFLCSKYVIPHMIAAGGGSIINTSSSTGAYLANSNSSAYVASKGGVTLLTRCMAIDFAQHGIRVNCIAPGPTDTPMLRNNLSEELLQRFASTFPMKRLGLPIELARAALFLASDESSFVTGLTMAVDGGQTIQVSQMS